MWVKPDDGQPGGDFILYGCTVLNTGEIVTLRLEAPEDAGAENEALFWQMAEHVQYHDGKE